MCGSNRQGQLFHAQKKNLCPIFTELDGGVGNKEMSE
jgi:hypothetical protein